MNIPLHLAILTSPLRKQVRLAAQTGIGEGRISKIVNAWIEPTQRERLAIAEALGKGADELFGHQLAAASPDPPGIRRRELTRGRVRRFRARKRLARLA